MDDPIEVIKPPTSKLGTANGWSETPLLVEKCEKAGHKQWSRKIGRCLHEHGCDICNYTFKVDSGD